MKYIRQLAHCDVCICARLAEAEAAITAGRWTQKHRNVLDELVTEFGDSASFALRLLAIVYW